MSLPFQKPAKQSTLKDLQEKQKEKTMPKVLNHCKWLFKSTAAATSTPDATHGINFPEKADVNGK